MISLYNKNETDFTHNGIVLTDLLSCEIEEELNGKYILELEHTLDGRGKWQYLQEEVIIKADGQLFRIHDIKKDLNSVSVIARHVFYDLLHNFLEDVRPTNIDGVGALNHILDNTQYKHRFTATGDVETTNTQYYIRKNPVEAILGEDSLVSRWNGEIDRDNYRIIFLNRLGQDRGVKIHYGKNLLGLDVNINTNNMITRLMPQGNDELLLPEKYIDSDSVGEYAFPYIQKINFNIGVQEKTEDQEEITEKEAIELLREEAIKYMENNKVDIPDVNIKVDLLLLENTEEYKDFKVLEKVNLGDTATISKNPLGLEFKSRIIRVKKDVLTQKNIGVEIGNPSETLTNTITKQIDASNTEIKEQINTVQVAANGKNKVFRGEKEPQEGMATGDLWYKPVGDGEVEMYQYDGDKWVDLIPDKVSLNEKTEIGEDFIVTNKMLANDISANKITAGTLNAKDVNLINMNASSIVTGTLDSINIKGGRITQERSGNRSIMEDGEIKSYIDGDLAMKWGGWSQEFYNTSNDLIGSIEPTRLLNRSGYGLALTVNHDFFTIGHMIDGIRYPVFRTEQVKGKNSTYVLGPYDGRSSSNRDAELFLGATAEIGLNPNSDMSRIRQASMIFRHNPSENNGNSVTMYVGGWSKYSDQHFEIRKNESGGDSSKRIGYVSEEAVRFPAAYDTESTFSTNMVRVNTVGELQNTSSSRRFKLDEKVLDIDYAKKLLEIDAKKWIDKKSLVERDLALEAGGLIAEDVHDAGLDLFVSYDEDNRPRGLSSNLWTLLIPLVKKQEEKINELENELSKMEELEQRLEKLENKVGE